MKRQLISAVAFLLLTSLIGCSDLGRTAPEESGDPPQPGPGRPLTAAERAIVTSDNAFGFRLFASLNRTVPGQNLFLCPLSVSMALGMTVNGAAGTTKDAMISTLGFAGITQEDINRSYASLSALLTGLDPVVRVQIANSIWYRPTLQVENAFKQVNMTYFSAEVNSINFADPSAAVTINGWVDRNTNGKITQVITPPIPDDIVMYLINAVYFKGSWKYRYDQKDTRADMFTRSDGSKTPCSMMSQTDTVPYFSQNGVQGIDLPYGNAGFSMTVILPPPGVDIDGFVSGLTQEEWDSWIGKLGKKEVTIYMPKFKLNGQMSLKTVLAGMGMGIAFSDHADFTGIDKRGSLAISDVLHFTFVQVDEEGTEAAGVTVVGVRATMVGPAGPAVVRLDRPFIYAIRENQSGTVLFIGKLAAPLW
jgi:serine protease inhibitor